MLCTTIRRTPVIGLVEGFEFSQIELPGQIRQFVDECFGVGIGDGSPKSRRVVNVTNYGIGTQIADGVGLLRGSGHAGDLMPACQESGQQGSSDHPGRL